MTNIRAFQSDDLAALYAVSLSTGFEGGEASHLYIDPKMMGHIYAAPYAVLEPSLCLVAEDLWVLRALLSERSTRRNGKTDWKMSGGRRCANAILILLKRHGSCGRWTKGEHQ